MQYLKWISTSRAWNWVGIWTLQCHDKSKITSHLASVRQSRDFSTLALHCSTCFPHTPVNPCSYNSYNIFQWKKINRIPKPRTTPGSQDRLHQKKADLWHFIINSDLDKIPICSGHKKAGEQTVRQTFSVSGLTIQLRKFSAGNTMGLDSPASHICNYLTF